MFASAQSIHTHTLLKRLGQREHVRSQGSGKLDKHTPHACSSRARACTDAEDVQGRWSAGEDAQLRHAVITEGRKYAPPSCLHLTHIQYTQATAAVASTVAQGTDSHTSKQGLVLVSRLARPCSAAP